jgi:hypothetical protein
MVTDFPVKFHRQEHKRKRTKKKRNIPSNEYLWAIFLGSSSSFVVSRKRYRPSSRYYWPKLAQ